VTWMCHQFELSTSGYYGWKARQTAPSARQRCDEQLFEQIRQVFSLHKGRYGVLRVWHQLLAQGIVCGRDRVARLMRQHSLKGKETYAKKPRSNAPDSCEQAAPNLLNRDFNASKPNQKWVADMTYIPTKQGWLYVSCVMDLFSRYIVGWSMRPDLTSRGPLDALEMALLNRKPEPEMLFHSDRGTQYTCKEMRRRIEEAGIRASNSRSGNCWDNASQESFFGRMKAEIGEQVFETREAARAAIFEYIEVYYNRSRSHSALGYLTPEQAEQSALS
jgi:putative transposase